jgi:murein tripeptide amidase MpaA
MLNRSFVFVCAGLICLLPLSSALGVDEKVSPLGKYDFYHYYDYEELTRYLKDINQAYPQLTGLTSLAKSDMGRDVWMLTINNPKTGKAEDKPALLIDQIHAGEVIAAMSNLYTIWYLLDNYGKDDHVTDIVDRNVWYIVPRNDVDGAESYLKEKPSGEDPDPVDDDKDFLFDEDPPEDVDGDGVMVQMRQVDPMGEWKVSDKDPRIMVKKAPDEVGGTYYKMYTEGLDNDGDGKINEDSFARGFLSNRNYPGNWRPDSVQRGGKRYPMQESITRAEVDFVDSHPNIAVFIQSHCCGRVILRPPTTAVDNEFPHKGDLRLYQVVAARALEHSGWNLATSVFEWMYPPGTPNTKPTQVYRDKEGNLKNLPEGMRSEEDEEPGFYSFSGENEYYADRGYYAWGSSLETMYNIFGIFSFADEHWAHPDYNRDGKISELERIRWNDEDMGGKAFVDWHGYDHPTLGKVEVGGWVRNKMSPPEGELIQKECEMGNAYKIYVGGLTPKLSIESETEDKDNGLFQVDITVQNEGFLPTALQHAQQIGAARPLVLEVEPDSNLEIILGEDKLALGHIPGSSKSAKTTYIVRKKDSSLQAALKAVVASPKAGRATETIVIQ